MKRFKVSEVAKQFGLSTTAIYKHLKRFQTHLKEHVTKEGGITLVSEEGVNILRESITASTISSREITPVSIPDTHLDGRLESMEKAMLTLAEQMKAMVEENRALRSEVSTLQKALEYKVPEMPASDRRADPREVIPTPAKKEPSFFQSVNHNLSEIQSWLQGVFSPFTEILKGG